MNKKSIIATVSGIVLLSLLGTGTLFLLNKNKKNRERNEKIVQIQELSENNEYSKALTLIDELLIINNQDEEVIQLKDQILKDKEEFELQEKLKKELKDKIEKEANSIFTDNILKEFTQLKNELTNIDPNNDVLKSVVDGITKRESDLLNKVNILINSMMKAQSEEEAKELESLITELMYESKKDFIKSQISDAELLRLEILNIEPDNLLAKRLQEKLLSLKKDLETKEEREAIERKVKSLLELAKNHLANNNFKEAEVARKDVLKIDPKNIAAINMEQEIIQKEKEKILKDNIAELVAKATSAINKNQLEYAQNLIKEILKLDGKSPEAAKLQKDIEQKKRDNETKKQKELEEAIKKLITEAKSSFQNNNLLDSEDKYNKVLQLDQNNIDALKGLADISIKNSDNDPSEIPRAIRKVLKVLEYEPNNISYLTTLADLYERNKDYTNQIKTLDKLIQIKPSAEMYVKAGVASFKLNNFNQSITYFDLALKLDPKYPETYYPYALTYEKLGDNANRKKMLLKGVEIRPDHAATIYELGRFYTDEKDFNEALNLFLKALDLKKNTLKYQMGVALAYYNLKQFEKSIEIYENILKTDKTISEVYYNLSLARMELKDYDQALTDISLAIKLKPTVPAYIYTIGQISEALGSDDKATAYYLKAVQLDNTYYKPMLNLGNIYDKYGRYEDGLKLLKIAYSLNSKDSDVSFSLGASYLHNKMYKEAIELLENSYNNDKTSPLKLYTLSLAYTEIGETKKAENGFLKVIEMDNRYEDAYFYLGQLLFSLERKDEARTYFKKVLELNPESKYKSKITPLL